LPTASNQSDHGSNQSDHVSNQHDHALAPKFVSCLERALHLDGDQKCDVPDIMDPTGSCSGHGTCKEGETLKMGLPMESWVSCQCECKKGWGGYDCNLDVGTLERQIRLKYGDVALRNDIIMVLTGRERDDWFENWLKTLRRWGLEDRVIRVCLDGDPSQDCVFSNFGITLYHERWHRYIAAKQLVLFEGLKLGVNVLFSDTDLVLEQDPRPYLKDDVDVSDVIVTSDSWHDDTPDHIENTRETPIKYPERNVGFMWVKDNCRNLTLFHRLGSILIEAQSRGNPEGIYDQSVFNSLLSNPHESNPDLSTLPIPEFSTMGAFWINKLNRRMNIPPVLVHWAFSYGSDIKKYRAREGGYWSMDPKEYYTGKFLTYSHKDLQTKEEERLALLRACGLAKALNRSLILPAFHCLFYHNENLTYWDQRERYKVELEDECTAEIPFALGAVYSVCPGVREHSFVENAARAGVVLSVQDVDQTQCDHGLADTHTVDCTHHALQYHEGEMVKSVGDLVSVDVLRLNVAALQCPCSQWLSNEALAQLTANIDQTLPFDNEVCS